MHDLFHVFKSGRLTVVGFEGKHLANARKSAEIRDSLLDLVEAQTCQLLVVDLADVTVVSSWILGVLASVQRQGVEVQLYHPSAEIRGVINFTRLNELLRVRSGLNDEIATSVDDSVLHPPE